MTDTWFIWEKVVAPADLAETMGVEYFDDEIEATCDWYQRCNDAGYEHGTFYVWRVDASSDGDVYHYRVMKECELER